MKQTSTKVSFMSMWRNKTQCLMVDKSDLLSKTERLGQTQNNTYHKHDRPIVQSEILCHTQPFSLPPTGTTSPEQISQPELPMTDIPLHRRVMFGWVGGLFLTETAYNNKPDDMQDTFTCKAAGWDVLPQPFKPVSVFSLTPKDSDKAQRRQFNTPWQFRHRLPIRFAQGVEFESVIRASGDFLGVFSLSLSRPKFGPYIK